MGRPKEFDLDNVLTAASNCFWADGIARTSISSLVEAMRIQRSSFYNSFNSREGILATVLERYIEASPLRMLMSPTVQANQSKPDLLLIDFILDFSNFLAQEGRGRGCLFFNGLSELTPQDENAYEIYQDYYAQLADGLDHVIRRLETEVPAATANGTVSLDHLLCIFIGLAHFSRIDPTELRLAKIGLDQLAGLSPHFAALIRSHSRPMEAIRQSEVAERSLMEA
ncbi:transcriptional regulator, TetR family [Cohaesibacter sp. ES.047]|uniref:TetR/AcrR family transcriptional regulator n=1 Tax=Cohaesibacter sp. ES.047 TaxID=1798205 RepID=UPI000BB8A852|nr:TetR family transcriptional regulator [Cohaesibacter sp. ES.047]SNY91950.1 transcriptional regulator, TetR family [Cohaesibacter sp. ES.047]